MPHCTYCGAMDGNNLDHVAPAAYTQNAKHFYAETVPACTECNILLGSRLLTTVPTRAAYLIGVYERRYKKIIKSPAWTEDELDELGPSMRDSILTTEATKRKIIDRIEHLSHVARN